MIIPIIENKVVLLLNEDTTKYMWLPLQWRFRISWHKHNKGRYLRRLHVYIRIPFLHIDRNNAFTEIGNWVRLIIFNY